MFKGFWVISFLFFVHVVQAQEFNITRDVEESFGIEGGVDQAKKVITVLEKAIADVASCGDSPEFDLFTGNGCEDPEEDPVVEPHAKQIIPDCPGTNSIPAWNGASWYCKTLTGVIVDCVASRTVPGGCTINFGQVNHGMSDSDYCSLGGDRGCYSTVTCNMGVQTYSGETCYNSNWQTGSWQVPCYDIAVHPAPPAPSATSIWRWDRTVSCPVAGDCDPTKEPASTGSCGVVASHGQCGGSINSCSSGTFSDRPDTGAANWSCNGVNGGNDVDCSMAFPPPPPPSNCFDNIGTAGCTSFRAINHGASSTWSCDAGYSLGNCYAECNNGSFINENNSCSVGFPGTWTAGSCNATCGPGSITGATCMGGPCDPGTNPNGNSCNLGACGFSGTWTAGSCSNTCGSGSITGSTCSVPGDCDPATNPDGNACTDYTGATCYTGAWSAGSCSTTCGAGTIGGATCSGGNGQCDPATSPNGNACNLGACAPALSWVDISTTSACGMPFNNTVISGACTTLGALNTYGVATGTTISFGMTLVCADITIQRCQ